MNFLLFITNKAKALQPLLHIITLSAVVVLNSCAKKQRTLFVFSDDATTTSLKRLALPAVRNVTATRHKEGVTVNWRPLEHHQLPASTILVGYHVYRMRQKAFIHTTSATPKPIPSAIFLDKKAKKLSIKTYYGVRAVVEHHNAIIIGPLSHLALEQ